MRIRAVALLAFLVSAALATPASAGSSPSARTLSYESPSVGRTLNCRVILPAGYESSGERYPVLYLLHGYSGDFLSWTKHRAEQAAAEFAMIVVLPDGGNSWYVNWAESAPGEKNAWEDALVKDLIGFVDSRFRTVAGREGRAISGLSMGGFGALSVGLRNPHLFCSVGSSSGAVDFARSYGRILEEKPDAIVPERNPSEKVNPAIGLADFDSQEERTPRGRIFATVEQCAAHDPFALVRAIPAAELPHLAIDCGTEDPFLGHNQEFLRLLIEHQIPFTYAQSRGEHRSAYWARELGPLMAIHAAILRRNLAAATGSASGPAASPVPAERR